jgi:hypothetical protein
MIIQLARFMPGDKDRQKVRTPLVPVVGLAYAAIGVAFAWPTAHVQAWRLGAWLLSAGIYGAQILYERFGVRSAPRSAALRVGVAAALGAFGLAAAANVHSLSVGASDRQHRLLLLALVIWPILTGLPAFLVAWVLSGILVRLGMTRSSGS